MMTVAKGTWSTETGYTYTCAQCNGAGMVAVQPCDHCYALNYDQIMQAFKTARGKRYYALLKAALSLRGKAIYDAAKQHVENNGKLTIADIIYLMVSFNWPRMRAKPFFEWLGETGVIPFGAYLRLQERGFKITKACEKLGVPIE
jgi:hypothetical protein